MTKRRIKRKMAKFIYGKIIGKIYIDKAKIRIIDKHNTKPIITNKDIEGEAILYHIETGDIILCFASKKPLQKIENFKKIELSSKLNQIIFSLENTKTSYSEKIGNLYFNWIYLYHSEENIYSIKI